MKRLALVLAMVFAVPTSASAISVGQKFKGFCLKDSKGKRFCLSTFKARILVFWYEGAKSKEQNRWIKNKLKKLRNTVASRKSGWVDLNRIRCSFEPQAE